MSLETYYHASCPNCESQFALDYLIENVSGEPEYCPFCGDEIPEESVENDDYEDEDSEDSWN